MRIAERAVLEGDHAVAVWIEAAECEVRLVVEAVDRPELTYRVSVTTRGEPAITADAPDACWGMWRGLPRRFWRDPFWIATRWIHDWMFPRQASASDPNLRVMRMREAYALCRLAAVRAADACDAPARAIATRFLPHARWYAYRAIAGNRTGRVAQLAHCCPGALILAYALAERGVVAGDRPADGALLANVVAGRPLRAVLGRGIEAWRHAVETRCALPRMHDIVWTAMRDRTTSAVAVADLQRLLIRRACSRVPTTVLWLPPPAGIAIDDMPAPVLARAGWYRAIKSAGVIAAMRELGEADRVRLAGFASAHGAALHVLSKQRRRSSAGGMLSQIVDAMLPAGRIPCRTSSLARVVAESDEWHRQQVTAAHDIEGCDVPTDTPLPVPALPTWSWDGFEARALTTAEELLAEGRSMRHCVASRLRVAIGGDSVYYAARHRRRRVTLEISRRDGIWTITEAAGFANAAVPTETLVAAGRFVANLNRAERDARDNPHQLRLPLPGAA